MVGVLGGSASPTWLEAKGDFRFGSVFVNEDAQCAPILEGGSGTRAPSLSMLVDGRPLSFRVIVFVEEAFDTGLIRFTFFLTIFTSVASVDTAALW